MKILALKFSARGPEGLPLRCNLQLETPGDLLTVRGKDLPAVYVVRQEDIGHLRTFADLVVDRGEKHPAKALSTILLRYDKIPLVRGSYRNTGQLKRSVRTLLANAVDAGIENIFLSELKRRSFVFSKRKLRHGGTSHCPLTARESGRRSPQNCGNA